MIKRLSEIGARPPFMAIHDQNYRAPISKGEQNGDCESLKKTVCIEF